jgi:hypothetical protein
MEEKRSSEQNLDQQPSPLSAEDEAALERAKPELLQKIHDILHQQPSVIPLLNIGTHDLSQQEPEQPSAPTPEHKLDDHGECEVCGEIDVSKPCVPVKLKTVVAPTPDVEQLKGVDLKPTYEELEAIAAERFDTIMELKEARAPLVEKLRTIAEYCEAERSSLALSIAKTARVALTGTGEK